MTTEGIRLAAGDGGQAWPLAVPRSLFTVYQPVIGGMAVLTWLNLYELSGQAPATDTIKEEVARRLGVPVSGLDEALSVLEQAGLLRRVDDIIELQWPGTTVPAETGAAAEAAASVETTVEKTVETSKAVAGSTPASPSSGTPAAADVAAPVPAPTAAGTGAPAAEIAAGTQASTGSDRATTSSGDTGRSGWDSDDAGLKAVVAFYHQRIGMLGPTQFERLRFWLDEMGMSSDVVALAIEETVQNAKTPRMNYLEAVLRNWYNDGVRTVADLQRSKQTRSSALPKRSEGSPNASAYESIDPDAVRRWKEMYADEYDG